MQVLITISLEHKVVVSSVCDLVFTILCPTKSDVAIPLLVHDILTYLYDHLL